MDILTILKSSSGDLLPEDFELFRTELAVGNYSKEYRQECADLMEQFEHWEQSAEPGTKREEKDITSAILVDVSELTPDGRNLNTIPFSQQFMADLGAMRLSEKYKSRFRTYIKTHADFNEIFIDEHFRVFEEWEMGAILSEITLSEAFLEKYFSVLNKEKIARYQLFSESFYQKHFYDFDAEVVLKKGKNEWRKKENRSKQFAVFLRLKGVQF